MRCRSTRSSTDSFIMSVDSSESSSKPSGSSKRSGSATSADSLAWLVLEFCDKGCLQVCWAALMLLHPACQALAVLYTQNAHALPLVRCCVAPSYVMRLRDS